MHKTNQNFLTEKRFNIFPTKIRSTWHFTKYDKIKYDRMWKRKK